MINDVVRDTAQGPEFYLPFVLHPGAVRHKLRFTGWGDHREPTLRTAGPIDIKIREAEHDCANFARRTHHLPLSCHQRLVSPVTRSRNVYYMVIRQTLLQEPGPCVLVVDMVAEGERVTGDNNQRAGSRLN